MQLLWKKIKSGQKTYLAFFCVGLLAGFFLLNLGKGILLGEKGLFDENTLYQMKYMTVDDSAFFGYIFRKRMVRLLVLAVLSSTYLGLVVCMGTVFWYGMSAGMVLASLTIRYGVKGIMLAFISIFPQCLLYIPMALALLAWCEELFRCIYVRGEFGAGDKGFVVKKAGRLAVILIAAALGCLLEGYVNPYLLLGFLKIF